MDFPIRTVRMGLVILLSAGLLLLAGQASAAAVDPPFAPVLGSPYTVGQSAYALAIGDLNHDGRPDLVTADERTGDLYVLLASPEGGFEALPGHSVGGLLSNVAIADVNGDGDPDVVTNSRSFNVSCVLFGNGDGTLAPQECYAAGEEPYGLAVADLNGDGHPDIVTASFRPAGTVSVLLNDGMGGFEPAVDYPTGSGPISVAAGDLNGDGRPDLVTADDGTVDVLFGNGKGGFAPAVSYPAGGIDPADVEIVDATGDGIPDVVYPLQYSSSMVILPGDGHGNLSAPITLTTARPAAVMAAAVGDINGDGIPDVVYGAQGSEAIGYFLGEGGGRFAPPVSLDATTAWILGLADLDGDGKTDIVTTEGFAGPKVEAFLNQGAAAISLGPGSTAALDFGEQAVGSSSAARSLTFRSSGSAVLPVTGVRIEGPGAASFSVEGDACTGRTLLVGEECEVSVHFAPEDAGAVAATLRIEGGGATSTVSLTGSGASASGTSVPPSTTASATRPAVLASGLTAAELRAAIAPPAKPQHLGRSRRVAIAKVRCPATSAACLLTGAKATVREGAGRRFRLQVLAPARLRPGARTTVAVRVPAAGVRGIGSRGATVQVMLTLAAEGVKGSKRVTVSLAP